MTLTMVLALVELVLISPELADGACGRGDEINLQPP